MLLLYVYVYIYINAIPPPKIDHFLCFEKDAVQETDVHMLGSTFKCSVVEDGCKIAHLPGLQHWKALQNCSPWQPELSTLQEFPRHCPSKAAKLQTWQSKSAKLQALQALIAKQTWQGFSSNTARLCKTATPTNLPKHCPSKGAKLQTWQGCKIANLQGSNTAGCKTFQASLLNCRALARLQNPTLQGCKRPLPTLPTCQSFNTAGFPLAARSAKLQIRLQNPNCKAPTLKAHPTARLFKPAKQSAKLQSKIANYNLLLTQHCKTSQARLPNYRPGGCKIANPICNQLHQH